MTSTRNHNDPVGENEHSADKFDQVNMGPLLNWLSPYIRFAGMLGPPKVFGSILITYNALTLAISCAAGWILFYIRYDDLSTKTDVLLHASFSAHTLFVYLWYIYRGARLRRVCRSISARFGDSPFAAGLDLARRPFDSADSASLLVIRLGAYNCFFVIASFALYALLLASKRQLIFPVWTPISLDNNVWYLLAAVHQMNVFVLYTTIQVSGCGVSIGGAFHVGASFDALGDAFRRAFRSPFTEERRRKFASCVQMHIAILELVQDYKAVYDTIIMEVSIFCEVVLCFIGFQIILAIEDKNYTRAVMHVPLVSLVALHLYHFCYPGQHITNKNEQFRVSLYTSAWQDLDLPLQRCVLMCLRQSLRPVRVTFKGIAHSSMQSFLNTLKAAFSYVNILLALRDAR